MKKCVCDKAAKFAISDTEQIKDDIYPFHLYVNVPPRSVSPGMTIRQLDRITAVIMTVVFVTLLLDQQTQFISPVQILYYSSYAIISLVEYKKQEQQLNIKKFSSLCMQTLF